MSLKLGSVLMFTRKHCTCVPHANKCNFPLQLRYRADLMWMKGAGCITEGSLNIQQAKKAGDLVSEVSKVLSLQLFIQRLMHTYCTTLCGIGKEFLIQKI